MTSSLKIRKATPDDTSLILHFIKALAEYEKLSHEVVTTESQLQEQLFSPTSPASVLIAELSGRPLCFV